MRQYHLKSYNDLFDPRINARVAYQMSNGGTNWQPWTTYTRGAYLKYLGHDIQVNGAGFDPNASTSDDAPAGSGHGSGDDFEIGSGQSLADLKAHQQHLNEQLDFAVGLGPEPKGMPKVTPAGPDQDALHTFLQNAQGELGETYVFGAKASASVAHPHALDCSGLTKWAAERAGAHLPDGAAHQYLALKKAGMLIPVKDAMHTPGALLFHFAAEPTPGQGEPEIAHVAISKGNGMTIEAADEQDGIVSWKAAGRFNYAAVIPGIGTTDTAGAGHVALAESHTGLDGFTDDGAAGDLVAAHGSTEHGWHWLGSDLGGGAATSGVDTGGHTFDDDGGGWDAGHH
jgi:cell wall-associated NlpC family hydrolase